VIIASGLILLGLVLLALGGEVLLRGAVNLATLLRMTPAVIGLTVVAAGTSVPELAVSALAAAQDKAAICVANVVGSNIFNLAFILGLGALIRPLRITGNTIRLEYPVLAIVTLLCLVIMQDALINRLDAALCLAIYVGFTAYIVSIVRRQMSEAEKREFASEVRALADAGARPLPRRWLCLVQIVAGVVLLGAGAEATVRGAVDMARLLGWSERIIGLTIVAVGTGLPEVTTTLISSMRGRDDVAIGNVIGSNLFNILGILGLSAIVAPLPVSAGIVASDQWWMLGITLLLFPLMFTGRRIDRWEGLLLLATYWLYIGFLLLQPAAEGNAG
jgi:cation:H+ antiporter